MFKPTDPIGATTFNKRTREVASEEIRKILGNKNGNSIPNLKIKNTTTSDLGTGHCLKITGFGNDNQVFYLEGDDIEPNDPEGREIVFLTGTCDANGGTATFASDGYLLARVSRSTGDNYAKPENAGNYLTSCEKPTRFRIIDDDGGSPEALCLLYVEPYTPRQHQVVYAGTETVNGEFYLKCNAFNADGVNVGDVLVRPASGVFSGDYHGKTVDGVAYTRVDINTRSAVKSPDPSYQEKLYFPYSAGDVINVIPYDNNEIGITSEVPYAESGTNRVWVKECT